MNQNDLYTLERNFGSPSSDDWRLVNRASLSELYAEMKKHAAAARRHKWQYRILDPQGNVVPMTSEAGK